MNRIACSTAAFDQDRPAIALAKIDWAGFRFAELRDPGSVDAPEIRASLQSSDLTLVSVSAPSLELNEEGLAAAGRSARLAADLDAPLITLPAPEAGLDLYSLASALNTLDRALASLPTRIGLLNRPGSCLARAGDFRELWEMRIAGRYTTALDPASAAAAGWDPLDWESLPEPPALCYLVDWAAGERRLPGAGTLPLDALVLRCLEREIPIVALLDGAEPWEVEPAAQQVRADLFQFEGLLSTG